MWTRRTQRAGFSLVEILIAFFVLMIGVLAVLTLFPLGLRESKQMVDTSIASLVARNARGMMEVHPFTYKSGSQTKKGNGTASMMHAKFGCDIAEVMSWVKVFPEDLLGSDDDRTFPKQSTEGSPFHRGRKVGNETRYDKVISSEHPQYSWDARFTIGRGIGETQVGDTGIRLNPPPGEIYDGGSWRPFSGDDMRGWFERYYRYYAVQISIYRNYSDETIASGEITLKTEPRSGGGSYDNDDPNRPLYSELLLDASDGDRSDIQANWHIRVTWNNCRSDWYRVERMYRQGGKYVYKLDRPFAPMVGAVGTQASLTWSVTDVVATNTLIEHFTTMLGSQLDDTDTRPNSLSIISH